jgi:predicted lipoprotein with Yx(FWY)xxD motif
MGNNQSFQQNPNANLGLKVANSQALGRNYVTDSSGRAVYIYTKDPANTSVCTGNCAEEWPPVIIPGPLATNFQQVMNQGMQNPFQTPAQRLQTPAQNQNLMSQIQTPGINKSKLGTISRPDGNMQLTLNNWPLYYYYMDANPGDIKGQTVRGIWYLIGPEGNPIIIPLIPQYQPVPNEQDALEGEYASGSASKGLAPVTNMPGMSITPYNEGTISYSEDWKKRLGYKKFCHYYRGKKWRNWAIKNKKDWKNRDDWSCWYKNNKNKWDHDYLRKVHNIWLNDSNNDWPSYNEWYDWDKTNVNEYY